MINGLIEVIVYVRDMDKQVRFYRDVLGLAVRSPADLHDYSNEYWVELETGACTVALHGGGSGKHDADTPKIVFAVTDIHAARGVLIGRGVAASEVRSPAPGIKVVDAADAEGNPFSLEAHEPTGH
ncbi:MAG: VOC family protein [Chloroflexi bacterium]|nr:VOC family protein [Chloroflexota bacterium]MCC6895124.1 VOC family protein [Anaerolineae bacterium]